MKRRAFITSASCAIAGQITAAEAPNSRGVPLRLEPLRFEIHALEPYIAAQTLRHHRQIHHTDSLNRLRMALKEADITVGDVVSLMPSMRRLAQQSAPNSVVKLGMTPRTIPPNVVEAIRTHGGAHVNHTIFWRCLAPPSVAEPTVPNAIAAALERDFGGVAKFKAAFGKATTHLVGDGWAWLSLSRAGNLFISTTPASDNPLMEEFVPRKEQGKPLLCLDLWSHSYGDQYGEDRERYLSAWWQVLNWASADYSYRVASKLA
jgi:superoxide dismutase, Fe-Mn family